MTYGDLGGGGGGGDLTVRNLGCNAGGGGAGAWDDVDQDLLALGTSGLIVKVVEVTREALVED